MDILNMIEPNQVEKLLIMRKEMEEQEQYRRFMERRHMFSQYGEELLDCLKKITKAYLEEIRSIDEMEDVLNIINDLVIKFEKFDDVKPTINLFEELGNILKPNKKDYCTQNNNDCNTCSLVNYGYDCKNNKL